MSKEKEKSKPELESERIKAKAQLTYFDAEKQEVKSLSQIFEATTKVQEVFIPRLGCLVKVGHISMKDFTKLTEKWNPKDPKDQVPLSLEMVYLLLKSADDTVDKKEVDGLPYHIAAAIITAVTGSDSDSGFQAESDLPTVPQDT